MNCVQWYAPNGKLSKAMRWINGIPTDPILYVRHSWRDRLHHERYKLYVSTMPRKLICQDCGGSGGEVVPILDDGSGPFEYCGWCEGTGYVTPYIRGQWLRWKRESR